MSRLILAIFVIGSIMNPVETKHYAGVSVNFINGAFHFILNEAEKNRSH
jgi:hypothetical protein